jgi:hypothetical protein
MPTLSLPLDACAGECSPWEEPPCPVCAARYAQLPESPRLRWLVHSTLFRATAATQERER